MQTALEEIRVPLPPLAVRAGLERHAAACTSHPTRFWVGTFGSDWATTCIAKTMDSTGKTGVGGVAGKPGWEVVKPKKSNARALERGIDAVGVE